MSAQGAKPDSIKLKDNIPDDVRTPGKDDAAEYIQEEVLARGRWPMDYSEMAEESGWSRQHIRNVIKTHFVEVDKSAETDGNGNASLRGRTLTIPDDVENVTDYLRGVQAGLEL